MTPDGGDDLIGKVRSGGRFVLGGTGFGDREGGCRQDDRGSGEGGGRYGVRANGVRCAWIASETNDRLFAAHPELRNDKPRSFPLGRLGLPEEVAQTTLFVCSGGPVSLRA